MFKDGLIYQEARMATERELKEDLAMLNMYGESEKGKVIMEIANFLEVLYMEKMLRLWLKDGVLLQKNCM